jgi:hypothetical protein
MTFIPPWGLMPRRSKYDTPPLAAGRLIEAGEPIMYGIENKNSDTWRDKNLLVVCAVEGYSHRYSMTTSDTPNLFREYGVTDAIRQCYGTLHTQDIDGTVYFAEDFIEARRQ